MQMVLTKACKVNGVRQQPGHRFDVPEKEARLWAALGRAKATAEPQQVESTAARALDLQPPDAGASRADRRNGGRYNRRDMRAED